jgi:hypothetical protein
MTRDCWGPPSNRSCWPTNRPVSYWAGLYDLQYRLYIGQAKWPTGQLVKQQVVIYLMRAYKVVFFSVYAGDLQSFLGDLLGSLISLVGDVKDHDEPRQRP